MLPISLKRLLATTLARFGYELRRTNPRATVAGALAQAKQAGLMPATVIDVGAAWGQFSQTCNAVFPTARYLLIEPLAEYGPALEALVRSLWQAEYVAAAATNHSGEVTLHVHPDLEGSSLHLEAELGVVNGAPRTVRAVTLDSLLAEREFPGPVLLKLDVQGAELLALAGAAKLLPLVDYLLLEVSLFTFFEGGSVMSEVVAYLAARGFAAYDVIGRQYRPLDGALAQLDIAFAKQSGQLRANQAYATAEQRQVQFKRARMP